MTPMASIRCHVDGVSNVLASFPDRTYITLTSCVPGATQTSAAGTDWQGPATCMRFLWLFHFSVQHLRADFQHRLDGHQCARIVLPRIVAGTFGRGLIRSHFPLADLDRQFEPCLLSRYASRPPANSPSAGSLCREPSIRIDRIYSYTPGRRACSNLQRIQHHRSECPRTIRQVLSDASRAPVDLS